MTKDNAKMTVKEAIAADTDELKTRYRVITDPLPLPFIPINTIIAAVNALKNIKICSKNKAE